MEIALLIAFCAVAYEVWVTAALVKAEHLSRGQRYAQISLVWFVPVVGALLCHWFLRLHGARGLAHEKRFVQREGLDSMWYRGPNDDQ